MNGNAVVVIIFILVLLGIAGWAFLRLRALHLTTAEAVKADLAQHVESVKSEVQQALHSATYAAVAKVKEEVAKVAGSALPPLQAQGAPSTPTAHAEAAAAVVADAVQAAALAAAADASARLQAAATAVVPPAAAAPAAPAPAAS